MKRRKYREPVPMTDEVKVELAANRKRKRVEEDERRVEASTNGTAASTWRADTLNRYVKYIITISGRERLEYMDAHPVSDLLREHTTLGWR